MALPAVLAPTRRVPFARLVANGLLQALAAAGKVLLIREGFDLSIRSAGADASGSLGRLALAYLLVVGTVALLRRQERLDAERIGQDYVVETRLQLFDHLRAMSPRAVERKSRGGLLLRFVGDLSALRRWVSRGIAGGVVGMLAVAGAVVTLAALSGRLALAVVAILAAGAALSARSGVRLRSADRAARRRRSRLASHVEEQVRSTALVRVCGQQERERRRLERRSSGLRDAMLLRAAAAGNLSGVAEATNGLALLLVLALGAHEVAAGRVSHGTVVAAMLLTRLLAAPVRRLSGAHEIWHEAQVARRNVERFFAEPTQTATGAHRRLRPGGGELTFERVGVDGVLREVEAVAPAGTLVAVLGPNGAGKSTLLGLAAGLVEADRGRVLLDGRPVDRCRRSSLRRAVGMVSPDLPLLSGSIERNLRYRWPHAPASELERVMRLCRVDELVDALPEGLATRLLPGGSNLSVGERQRIALARALLGEPRLLLLDEPEANLDASTRQLLEAAIRSYSGTVLWVTHQPLDLQTVDAAWWIECGRMSAASLAVAPGDAGAQPVACERNHGVTRQWVAEEGR